MEFGPAPQADFLEPVPLFSRVVGTGWSRSQAVTSAQGDTMNRSRFAFVVGTAVLGLSTLTACGGVVLLLGLLATTHRAQASARRTAAALNPEALAV